MTQLTSLPAELDPQARRALLAELLQERLDAARVEIPLTHGQQAMWFLHQLAPDSSAYNVTFSARVRSAVDLSALPRALQALIDRHAPLRTTYTVHDGKPVQVIHPRREVTLETVDAAGWDEATLYRRVNDAQRIPFDLEKGPLFRAMLFTRERDDHVLLLMAHHIAIDGWSVWVLLGDLGALYAAESTGAPAVLPQLATQYPDYVRWQNALVAGSEGERMWEYWRGQLAGELPVLNLPTDRPRPPQQTYNGATLAFDFDDELCERIRAFAQAERTTVYAVLLATYQVLLHRYSGQEDIVVGSPMAGRSRPEFTGLVGDFINMAVLRADISGAPTFRAFLGQVRETVLAALEHQEFPFALLVQRLAPKPDPSRSPIFQAAINLHNVQRSSNLADLFVPATQGTRVDVGGLQMEAYPMPQQEGQLDLVLQVIDANKMLYGRLQYNTDLFEAGTIERMAGHFRTLLEAVVADPERAVDVLPMLTNDERHTILASWNATAEPSPSRATLHGMIEAQTDRTLNALAVTAGTTDLTYAQLDQSANRLAHLLRRHDIGRGCVVGICLERSPELLIALLGVLKAGAAYLPLDPGYPAERLAFMLADSGAVALLTTADLAPARTSDGPRTFCLDSLASEIRHEPDDRPAAMAAPDDLAYLIYTSGSTGVPKGVEVPHHAVVNFLSTMSRHPGLTSSDVLVAVTTIAFDIAALELFLPLSVGAHVILADRDTTRDGRALLELLRASRATTIQATPVTFRLLLQHGLREVHGLRCFCGGEAMPVDLARDLLEAGVELWNLYGPTETTIWSTVHRVDRAEAAIPAGRPIGNTQIYILDSLMQPLPPGVAGDIYIGGHGVARGYRNRPELTAERFLPNPFVDCPEARLYRTGDLGRYLPDGTIVVMGRTDHQVKIRGFRIELGEIEAALGDLPDVLDAVVTVREDRPGDQRLVAYLTIDDTAPRNPGALRTALRHRLPDYMTPSSFVFLDKLPRTTNGKLDRAALPAPHELRVDGDTGFVAPVTTTEQTLATIWKDILTLQRVSTVDTFFDLGGHSLQAVEMIATVEQQLGVRPNAAYVQTQTLGQLAAICDGMAARGEVRELQQATVSTGKIAGAMRRMLGAGSRLGAR